jgi:hypothetical protein
MTAGATLRNPAGRIEVDPLALESIGELLTAPPVHSLIAHLFGQTSITTVVRPASFLIRLSEEVGYAVDRLIVLPPMGFTADAADLMSPHPEPASRSPWHHLYDWRSRGRQAAERKLALETLRVS